MGDQERQTEGPPGVTGAVHDRDLGATVADETDRERIGDSDAVTADLGHGSRGGTDSGGDLMGREGRAAPSIAGYKILGELGRGGMGVVYEGRQVLLDRPCALKMILAGAHASPEASARFLTEATAVARIQHPNVVQIRHIAEADGLPFFELEYVEGGSLDRRLDGTPWPAPRAAALVEALTRGVAEAHRLGIVHRDLKPANVLLSADGTPKIADFGLAKSLGLQSGLTATESILGTPSYMAPEQAQGKAREVGPAADIYSLGAILYELLAGRPPFKGATLLETLDQVKNAEVVPPSRLVPGTPRDAETIALKCLDKDPARRYGSAPSLAEDLRRFQAGEPIAARPVIAAERAWRWCRRNPGVAALLALVLALLTSLGVGTAWAAVYFRGQLAALQRAERERRQAQARSVLTALPDAVPVIVEELRSSRAAVLPDLRRALDESEADPARRLRIACVLTLLGDDHAGFLVGQISQAAPNECRNVLLALRAAGPGCLIPLRAGFAAAATAETRARFASSLLALGEPDAARSMLDARSGPSERSAFIHHFSEWHGDLADLPDLLLGPEAPDFRSGLCAALGRIAPERLLEPERRALEPALARLYREAPDGGTHGASGWALRRWGIEPPAAGATPEGSAERDWFVNGLGMTLIALPTGPLPTRQALMLPVAMADREVTVEQFRTFLDDPGTPAAEKPRDLVLPTADAPGLPVGHISWNDAALFCNWLSRREGLSPCYEAATATSGPWRLRLEAGGYRLPTHAEWEYATRAGSATRWPVGDRMTYLADYAVYSSDRPEPVGSRAPNRWGLFDLAGNHWEFAWESTSDGPGAGLHPVGPVSPPNRIFTGEAYDSGAYLLYTFIYANPADVRDHSLPNKGFRVVCGFPGRDLLGRLAARARRLHPDDPEPHRHLEAALGPTGDAEAQALRREVAGAISGAGGRAVLGRALAQAGDWPGAVAELEAAGDDPDGAARFGTFGFTLAGAYGRLGDEARARSAFDRADAWLAAHRTAGPELRRARIEALTVLAAATGRPEDAWPAGRVDPVEAFHVGNDLGRRGRWAAAARLLAIANAGGRAPFEAAGLGADYTHSWQLEGQLLLAAADRRGYDAFRLRLLHRIYAAPGEFTGLYDFERAAKVGLLAPASDPGQAERFVELARRALRASNAPPPSCYLVLGLAEHRAGRDGAAVGLLNECLRRTDDTTVAIPARLALALALKGRGDTATARAQLAEGRRLMAERMPAADADDFGPLYWAYLLALPLAREAEALLVYDPGFPADPFAH